MQDGGTRESTSGTESTARSGTPLRRRAVHVALGVSAGVLGVLLAVRLGMMPPAPPDDPNALAAPYPAPPLELTAHTGEAVSLAELDDRVNVVFFGYTHCPDVCPVTLAALTRAVEALGDRGERVRALMVTVDPARDSVARLARYMESFHPSFMGLTGTEAEVREVTGAWGVFHQRAEPGDSDRDAGYLVDHSARSFVVAPDGRIHMTFAPGTGATEMAESLERLLDAF